MDATTLPLPTEYVPLTPDKIALLRLKADRGELTPEDTRLFIMETRAAFTAMPTKKPTARAKGESEAATKLPPAATVDFF